MLTLVSLLPVFSAQAQDTSHPAAHKRIPSYTEEGDRSCFTCHAGVEMRAVQSGAHANLKIPDRPGADYTCEACHGPGSIHISRAHGGRGFPPLTEFGRGKDKAPREAQLAACLGCHGRGDAVSKPMIFQGGVHDRSNINCSTCHTVHADSDPMQDHEAQAATCFRCHRKMKTEHPRAERLKIHARKCSGCHDVHRPRTR